MPIINSLLHAKPQRGIHEDSPASAEFALAEILENHRAAGHVVQDGLHNGHRAWHVITASGAPLAVFWISDADEGVLA